MNNERRKKLKEAIKLLEIASKEVDRVSDQENDCMMNTPESLQCTERYEAMETAVDALSDASSSISDAIDSIEEAIA